MAMMTSAGGSLSRYPAGTVVTVPRVIGHRDLGLTECPGERLYAQVKSIRKLVQKRSAEAARRPPAAESASARRPVGGKEARQTRPLTRR